MIGQYRSRFISSIRLLPTAACAVVVATACLVLASRMFEIGVFRSLLPGWQAMTPVTSFCFVLCSIALWLMRSESRNGREFRLRNFLAGTPPRLVALACAMLAAGAGLLMFVLHLFDRDLGVGGQTVAAGAVQATEGEVVQSHMPVNTAINFLLTGGALLLLDVETRRGVRPAQHLSLAVLFFSLMALLGYAYAIPSFYFINSSSDMTAQAAFCFLALSVGIVCARTKGGMMAVLTSGSAGGYVARRMLLAAVLVPSALGWLQLAGGQAGYYDTTFGVLLLVAANMLVLLMLIWRNATSLHHLDAKRMQAEAALLHSHAELERRVNEQTAELARANQDLWAEIREREKIEQDLRASREELQDFFENAPVGAHKLDPDGVILWANKAELDLLGYARQDYIGRRFAEFHADREVIEDILARLQRGESVENWEAALRASDGSIRHALISSNVLWRDGQFIHTRGFTRDITERKQAEARLRKSEELFRLTADSAPVMIWMSGTDKLCYWFNQGWLDFTGRAMEAEIGVGWADGVHPDDFDRCVETYVAAFENREEFRQEYRLCRYDGEYRWILDSGVPHFHPDGSFAGYIGSCIDIHERKQVEESLRLSEEARDRLLQSEQLARQQAETANRLKDEFLATVSHELRAPLNAIQGWVKLLRNGRLQMDEAARALETIERSAHAQNRIISDLLDVSRIINGKLRLTLRPLQPAVVIASAVEALRPDAAAKEIQLEARLAEDAGPISADSDRLRQIVWNLTSNAIKFTQPGGRVEVRLERINSDIQIVVSDTGIGIAPDFLPHVFDRFRQGDSSSTRRQGGLGLGLAIVRHLTDMHGGVAFAESAGVNRGATFIVRMPLLAGQRQANDNERAARNSAARANSPPRLDGLRVLVVDDDPDARELVRVILTHGGASVTTAGSVSEAMAVFEGNGGWRPDLLISDIEMPEADGYTLIRRLRAMEPQRGGAIPAIALTAYARIEDRLRALNAGFQLHVAKPVEPEELLTSVAGLTGKLDKRENHPQRYEEAVVV